MSETDYPHTGGPDLDMTGEEAWNYNLQNSPSNKETRQIAQREEIARRIKALDPQKDADAIAILLKALDKPGDVGEPLN